MKIVLACLMCFVLGASECFALDGGPVYTSPLLVTGTYAGVFVPVPAILDPGPPPVTQRDNSLAIFTLSIVKNNNGNGTPGTGTVVVFRNGILYSGSIDASADPDSAKLSGVVTATFQSGPLPSFSGSYVARGQFVNTRMKPNANRTSTTTVRIRGKASLTYTTDTLPADPNGDSGGALLYQVHAFKQAEAP